jgi:hypothetical protein
MNKQTNKTPRLLHIESKFNLTLFPFEFSLEEGINQSPSKIFLKRQIVRIFAILEKIWQNAMYFVLPTWCHGIRTTNPNFKV